MSEKTEMEMLDFIISGERNDNLLFNDVPENTMSAVITLLSQTEVRNNGYLLIDFAPEEIKHIEEMIVYTDNAFSYGNSKEVKTKIRLLQKSIEGLNAIIESNPPLTEAIEISKKELLRRMSELEASLTKDKKYEDLSRFLMLSAIAEEYVLGKIVGELVKVPGLAEKYRIDNIDTKLQYFEEFLKKDGISPEEYEDFNVKRFAIIMESLPLLQWSEVNITCCFTNFQNISNPLINRVVNNFTAFNTRVFRTMIFTSDNFMLTTECRDEGFVQEPYEYRAYTLDKTKRPVSRWNRHLEA